MRLVWKCWEVHKRCKGLNVLPFRGNRLMEGWLLGGIELWRTGTLLVEAPFISNRVWTDNWINGLSRPIAWLKETTRKRAMCPQS